MDPILLSVLIALGVAVGCAVLCSFGLGIFLVAWAAYELGRLPLAILLTVLYLRGWAAPAPMPWTVWTAWRGAPAAPPA